LLTFLAYSLAGFAIFGLVICMWRLDPAVDLSVLPIPDWVLSQQAPEEGPSN
jgi:hypothetical protein